MSIFKRLLGIKVDVLDGKDGSKVERITGKFRGKDVQVNRHDGDDSQVTVSVNGQMLPRIMHLDDVEDAVDINT